MNGKPSNPPSGTVVDSDVTLPERFVLCCLALFIFVDILLRYDFFLVSQSVNQGTVNPTYIQKLDVVLNEKPQIVMVVIPNDKGDHYAAVKKKCHIEKPTPSQCVTSTILNKPKGLMSVASKVAVQRICKLSGEPWAVDIPMKGTMVIG